MLIAALSLFVVGCTSIPVSEDGTQCLKTCFYPEGVPQSSVPEIDSDLPEVHFHAIFKRGLSSSNESVSSYRCDSVTRFAACSSSCPSSRLDPVAQQRTEVVLKACALSVPDAGRKADRVRAMSCPQREHDVDEGVCKDTASCLFGSALDELKEQYPEDVVIAATAEWKLILAFALEDPKSQYRPACSALFEPYTA